MSNAAIRDAPPGSYVANHVVGTLVALTALLIAASVAAIGPDVLVSVRAVPPEIAGRIREARGFQPEAHVGIGRLYEDKGQYELAAREFKIAVDQLSDTEPIIYQLLGAAYEKIGKNPEAIAAYENYLRLAPNGSMAGAVRSIVEQLKSQQP